MHCIATDCFTQIFLFLHDFPLRNLRNHRTRRRVYSFQHIFTFCKKNPHKSFSTFRKVYNFVAFQQWNDIFEIGVYLRFVLTCRNFANF